MCAIIGALVTGVHTEAERKLVNQTLATIWERSLERGKDGRGFRLLGTGERAVSKSVLRHGPGEGMGDYPRITRPHTKAAVIIGNLRAEPTTEYVEDKHEQDQQPYTVGAWSIVHNGTIANDKELRADFIPKACAVPTSIDSAAIVERLASNSMCTASNFAAFVATIKELKGSYAILAIHEDEPDAIYVAANYRPIWYVTTPNGTYFASARHYFPNNLVPKMVAPYTAMRFHATDAVRVHPLREGWGKKPNTALVVCSGGLDSVVAATYAQKKLGMDLHLIHFLYGSRAEAPEVQAVKDVAQALGAKLTLFPLAVYDKQDSPLLRDDAEVAGGEAGAEFAHEWVPARNLLLLSVATAFAEAQGIGTIVLGNNLEEAGAYPDNEPEFIAKFNDLLPFAVGDGKRMQVIMPVGNHMKHEIVALGHEIAAPMHLTWSCYRAGTHHCGTCGPCYMRRKAFAINNLPEVIEYVSLN